MTGHGAGWHWGWREEGTWGSFGGVRRFVDGLVTQGEGKSNHESLMAGGNSGAIDLNQGGPAGGVWGAWGDCTSVLALTTQT